jgi:hypothetical protein
VDCERCGVYQFSETWLVTIKESEQDLIPHLSAETRRASDRRDRVVLDSKNWKEIAVAQSRTPISVKVRKLLELAAARSKPGECVQFQMLTDPPLVDAVTDNEFSFLVAHLKEAGYLDKYGRLTAKGWGQIQAAATSGVPGKCFVAMSFDPSLNSAYERGIYLAVKEDCQMEPVIIDRVHHNEKICDKLIAEIRTAHFLVADVTLQRAGVYFEAGFAMGLGRPVIWTCRQDDLPNVHFDTRQYSHVVWRDPEDLRTKLADRVKATIPGAV